MTTPRKPAGRPTGKEKRPQVNITMDADLLEVLDDFCENGSEFVLDRSQVTAKALKEFLAKHPRETWHSQQ